MGPFIDKFVQVYLDDILAYSGDGKQHAKDVAVVLEALRKNKLYAKLSKCQLGKTEIEFLGIWISPKRVQPMANKLKAVATWPTPKNVHEVRSFLGLCSFYRRFILQFSQRAAELTKLRKEHSEICRKHFVQPQF